MKNMDEIENLKRSVTAKYCDTLKKIYQDQIELIFDWFQETFPEKDLKWVSENNTGYWLLDGCRISWNLFEFAENGVIKKPEFSSEEASLLPLWEFCISIHNAENLFNQNFINIGSIKIN